MRKQFSREELLGRGLPFECSGGDIIEDRIVRARRWSIDHVIVWRFDDQPQGEAYRATYSIAATEVQSERPWQFEPTVEAEVVHRVQRVAFVWEPKEG